MITRKDRFGVAALGNKALQRRSFTTHISNMRPFFGIDRTIRPIIFRIHTYAFRRQTQ